MKARMAREQDWRLRVFDSLAYPAIILRPDRSIIAVNQVFQSQFDVQEADLVGTTCRGLAEGILADPDLPCGDAPCPLSQTLATRRGHSVQRRIDTPEGGERFEDRVFSPILDEEGEVRYVIESIRDITRVKNLERMYTGMREFVDRVVQSSPSAIVAADRQGRIMLMNRAAEELFGRRFVPKHRMTIQAIYPPGIAQRIMRTLRDDQAGGHGKLPPTQVDILSSTGEHVPVEMTAAIIYEDGHEVATMGIYNDLRGKLEAERKLEAARLQLMQSEKLASLGRLAAGVAHEINNPLTGILLYGSLMAESLEPDHPLQKKIACVLDDATRCHHIVRDLLAYSRQTTSSREIFDLNTMVTEALSHIRDQRLFLQVKVVKDFASEPLLVRGDRKQLGQVVVNLVMNALDAMEGHGTLTLRTSALETARSLVEVSDTGTGIAPEHGSRVFDPFFTTKELGRGTGLGLSTAYGILQENGGSISIADTGPHGTTFHVELPTVSGEGIRGLGFIG